MSTSQIPHFKESAVTLGILAKETTEMYLACRVKGTRYAWKTLGQNKTEKN